MSELKGIIKTKGNLKSTINTSVKVKGAVSVGGTLITSNLSKKGDKGDAGNDGYSPSASVSKVGNKTTIIITDKDGTTTADVYDGSGAGVFTAEYNVTTYSDVYDAYDAGQSVVCLVPGADDATYLPLVGYDGDNNVFYFIASFSKEEHWVTVSQSDGWDDYTTSYDQVQADWNEADSTAADYIKNKPTIPTKTSDLNNDSGFLTTAVTSFNGSTGAVTYTAPVTSVNGNTGAVTVSVPTITDTYSGTSSDGMSGKAVKSAIDALDGTVSGSAGAGNTLTAFSQTDGKVSATFGNISITKSQVSDFPSLASVATSGDYDDLTDKPAIHNVPSGGTSGQVLTKDSNDDYDLTWTTVSGGGGGEIVYCTCTDSASTVAKTATVVTGTFSSLTTGAQVAVKFTYTNTATNPTLNVNSTGAKGIRRGGTTYVGTNANESWNAGTVVFLLYDGVDWQIVGWLNTTYTGGTGAQIITGTEALNKVWSPQQIHDGIVGLLPTVHNVPSGGSSDQVLAKNSGTDYDLKWSTITVPTITDTYSGTSSDGMSGKAVKSAIDALDATISGSAGSGKTLTAFSQTDGKVSATFGNISITKSQVSDFPTLASVATSGDYDDLTDKPTIPTVNNATLTIQKNGTDVQTFTANASSNATANIVVHDVPSGGSTDQVLAKNSNSDYDLKWANAGGGGSGTLVQLVRW